MQALDLNLATRPFRNNTLLWVSYCLAVVLLGVAWAFGLLGYFGIDLSLEWNEPPVDLLHGPATSYRVQRATSPHVSNSLTWSEASGSKSAGVASSLTAATIASPCQTHSTQSSSPGSTRRSGRASVLCDAK